MFRTGQTPGAGNRARFLTKLFTGSLPVNSFVEPEGLGFMSNSRSRRIRNGLTGGVLPTKYDADDSRGGI